MIVNFRRISHIFPKNGRQLKQDFIIMQVELLKQLSATDAKIILERLTEKSQQP